MKLDPIDLAEAIRDGTRTDCRGRNPMIYPVNAALHVHALLVERGLVEKLTQHDLPFRQLKD